MVVLFGTITIHNLTSKGPEQAIRNLTPKYIPVYKILPNLINSITPI